MHLQTTIGPDDGVQLNVETRHYASRTGQWTKLRLLGAHTESGILLELDELTALHAVLGSIIDAHPAPES